MFDVPRLKYCTSTHVDGEAYILHSYRYLNGSVVIVKEHPEVFKVILLKKNGSWSKVYTDNQLPASRLYQNHTSSTQSRKQK